MSDRVDRNIFEVVRTCGAYKVTGRSPKDVLCMFTELKDAKVKCLVGGSGGTL